MADLRVLKLALLAETKDFVKGLDSAEKNTKSFSKKLSSAVKKSALAFAALGAAAGAAAIKIGVDAVKAAIEDQASQAQLARALKNSTDATDAQIASTEKYITKIQNQTGLQDGDLRQSFASLIRVTKDHTKAQELQSLAIDVAAGTGKDLNTVTEALTKAYGGNLTALERLDPGLRDLIKSGAETDEIFDSLGETFGGSAADAADTLSGRMEIIKRRVEDAQKALGIALLPKLEQIAEFINEKLVPAFEGFIRGLTGGTSTSLRGGGKEANSVFNEMQQGLDENENSGYNLGRALRDLAKDFGGLFSEVDAGTGPESGLARFLDQITEIIEAISKLINFIDNLITKYREYQDSFKGFPTIPGTRDLGELGVGGIGAIEASRRAAQEAGEKTTREPNTILFDRLNRPTNLNLTIKGSPDPQAAAREIFKLVDKGNKTTGSRFAFGFR